MASHTWVVDALDHTCFSRFGQLATCTQPRAACNGWPARSTSTNGRLLLVKNRPENRETNSSGSVLKVEVTAMNARMVFIPPLETRPRRQARSQPGLARTFTHSHIRSVRRRATRAPRRCSGPGAVHRTH